MTESREPDGRRCCSHAGKDICPVCTPQRKQSGKGIPANEIVLVRINLSQLIQDGLQGVLCTISKGFVSENRRSGPWRQIMVPPVHLHCNQIELRTGHLPDGSHLILHHRQIMTVNHLNQDIPGLLITKCILCHHEEFSNLIRMCFQRQLLKLLIRQFLLLGKGFFDQLICLRFTSVFPLSIKCKQIESCLLIVLPSDMSLQHRHGQLTSPGDPACCQMPP